MKGNYTVCFLKVLCPRCETGCQKLKSKRVRDVPPAVKKNGIKLSSLGDVEMALSESKDTALAVRPPFFFFFYFNILYII